MQSIELARLHFDPILRIGYKGDQALEPDLQQAQNQMKWADKIILVFPIWWGGMPTLLKGFIDRTLFDRWLYGSPVIRQLRMPILRFCGIKLTHTLYLAPIIKSTVSQREAWLDKVARLAKKA